MTDLDTNKPQLLPKLYLLLVFLQLIAETIDVLYGNPTLIYVIKPLLMPTLLMYIYVSTQSHKLSNFLKIVAIAVFFSWLGDLLLMFDWDKINLFLYGLGAFLLTHILYSVAFRMVVLKRRNIVFKERPLLAIGAILVGFTLIYSLIVIKNRLFSEVQVPVIIYAIAIILMFISALSRENRVSEESYQLVLTGAFLFMFSDTLIAINRFTSSFEGMQIIARVLIMSFYTISQFLIVKGCIKQEYSMHKLTNFKNTF